MSNTYYVVSNPNLAQLIKDVDSAKTKNWKPQGGLAVSPRDEDDGHPRTYYQALYRPDEGD